MRRVCLVGSRAIAETHAEVLAGLPGTEVAAVVDPSAAARERFAVRRSVAAAFADPAEAVERAAARPHFRDLRSRGLAVRFDVADAKRAPGWQPVAAPERFYECCFGRDGADADCPPRAAAEQRGSA